MIVVKPGGGLAGGWEPKRLFTPRSAKSIALATRRKFGPVPQYGGEMPDPEVRKPTKWRHGRARFIMGGIMKSS